MGYWKYVLTFALSLLLLLAALRYGMRSVSQDAKAPAQKDPAEWAAWKEQRFDDLGFSLRHPADSPVIAGPDATYPVAPMLPGNAAETRFTVKVPKTLYAGTRFRDAFVSVSAADVAGSTDQERESLCMLLMRPGSGTRPLANRDEVAGTTFATGGVSDSAAGVRSESVVRHAWFKGHCIEITENMFSMIGGRTKDFDRVDAWNRMDAIAHTFRPLR